MIVEISGSRYDGFRFEAEGMTSNRQIIEECLRRLRTTFEDTGLRLLLADVDQRAPTFHIHTDLPFINGDDEDHRVVYVCADCTTSVHSRANDRASPTPTLG